MWRIASESQEIIALSRKLVRESQELRNNSQRRRLLHNSTSTDTSNDKISPSRMS
jgi:hypothetical protein